MGQRAAIALGRIGDRLHLCIERSEFRWARNTDAPGLLLRLQRDRVWLRGLSYPRMTSVFLIIWLMLADMSSHRLVARVAGRVVGTGAHNGAAAKWMAVRLLVVSALFLNATALVVARTVTWRLPALAAALAIILGIRIVQQWFSIVLAGWWSIPHGWATTAYRLAVAMFAVVFASFILRPYLLDAYIVNSNAMVPRVTPSDWLLVNKLSLPRRGDIVLFRLGAQVSIARVVALPSEDVPGGAAGLFSRTALAKDEFWLVGDSGAARNDSRTKGPVKLDQIVGVVDWIYWLFSRIRLLATKSPPAVPATPGSGGAQ